MLAGTGGSIVSVELFRPVGLEELRLIYEAEMRSFPPRLPDQPIFYPVTNAGYASQIARDWNTKSGTKAGFVTRFFVEDRYVSKFEGRVVGAKEHEELWVPSEELAEFNTHIDGRVDVIGAFFGVDYQGHVPQGSGLQGKSAREQFVALSKTADGADLIREMAANHVAVFLNFFFWEQADFAAEGIDRAARDNLLGRLRRERQKQARTGVDLGIVATSGASG